MDEPLSSYLPLDFRGYDNVSHLELDIWGIGPQGPWYQTCSFRRKKIATRNICVLFCFLSNSSRSSRPLHTTLLTSATNSTPRRTTDHRSTRRNSTKSWDLLTTVLKDSRVCVCVCVLRKLVTRNLNCNTNTQDQKQMNER